MTPEEQAALGAGVRQLLLDEIAAAAERATAALAERVAIAELMLSTLLLQRGGLTSAELHAVADGFEPRSDGADRIRDRAAARFRSLATTKAEHEALLARTAPTPPARQ